MTNISPTSTLENFPSVFLNKHDGLSGQRKLVRPFSSPTKFQLIPLTPEGIILDPEKSFEGREQYLKELRQWKHVALYCEKKGAYLSCQQKTHISGLGGDSALVEYQPTIGDSERFEFLYYSTSETFAFRSHNGLYLSNIVRKALLGPSIVFRSESRKEASTILSHRSWEITPVLNFSSADQHIKFVGVIDNSKRVVMKFQPMEEDEEDQQDYQEQHITSSLRKPQHHTSSLIDYHQHYSSQYSSLGDYFYHEPSLRDNAFTRHAAHSVLSDILAQGLRRGESTRFCTHDGDSHYYIRDMNGVVYMVVASEGFSRALAGECVNDLREIHKKFGRCKRRRRNNPQTEKRIQTELEFLVWNYNEHNESFRRYPLKQLICIEMEDAIDRVLECKGGKIDSEERAQELSERVANNFRTIIRKLRPSQISKWFAVQAAKVIVIGSRTVVGAKRWNKSLMWKKYVPSMNYGVQ